MWSICKSYIGVAFIAFYVNGDERMIETAIKNRDRVVGILPCAIIRSSNDNKVRAYQGVNVTDHKLVTLKYSRDRLESQHEFRIYKYLDAIENPEVEKYGILPLNYYREFGEMETVSVFPPFDINLWQKNILFLLNMGSESETLDEFETLDCLILFRNFVRQSRYIHRKGMRIDDVNPINIVLRGGRSFLFDLGICSRLNETSIGGTIMFGSRRYNQQIDQGKLILRLPIDDWESFFYTMARISMVNFAFFIGKERADEDRKTMNYRALSEKENINAIRNQIMTDIECVNFRNVMLKLADEVFQNNGSLPNYDEFDQLLTEEINKIVGENGTAVFSWLKDEKRQNAIKDLEDNPPATAEEIGKISTENEFKPPNYDHFVKKKNKKKTNTVVDNQ